MQEYKNFWIRTSMYGEKVEQKEFDGGVIVINAKGNFGDMYPCLFIRCVPSSLTKKNTIQVYNGETLVLEKTF